MNAKARGNCIILGNLWKYKVIKSRITLKISYSDSSTIFSRSMENDINNYSHSLVLQRERLISNNKINNTEFTQTSKQTTFNMKTRHTTQTRKLVFEIIRNPILWNPHRIRTTGSLKNTCGLQHVR